MCQRQVPLADSFSLVEARRSESFIAHDRRAALDALTANPLMAPLEAASDRHEAAIPKSAATADPDLLGSSAFRVPVDRVRHVVTVVFNSTVEQVYQGMLSQ